MTSFKNILVATDTRLDTHTIVDEAALIAHSEEASLTIVDVVPEFPWVVRMALREHQTIRDLVVSQRSEQLEKLAAPLRTQGIRVTTKVLRGRTSVEIIRQVLRDKHDLVFRVARGKDSRRKGYFGNTGLRLLRDCPCAVWLAPPAPSPLYRHVMACVDTASDDPLDAELNTKVYQAAEFVSRQHHSRLSVVHAWSIFGEEFLFTRTKMENFEALQRDVYERTRSLLDKFLQLHGSSVDDRNTRMLKGAATDAIPAFASQESVDLIVMGTAARSGAAGWVMGNTAEQILNSIQCSVLALKPDDFVCPILLPAS